MYFFGKLQINVQLLFTNNFLEFLVIEQNIVLEEIRVGQKIKSSDFGPL